VFAAVQIDEND